MEQNTPTCDFEFKGCYGQWRISFATPKRLDWWPPDLESSSLLYACPFCQFWLRFKVNNYRETFEQAAQRKRDKQETFTVA